jgi:hydroxyacylglutathione hydrolase
VLFLLKIKPMLSVDSFTFNPFQENTYILSDASKQCIIMDPGCYTEAEKNELRNFISASGLIPVRLINTHAHIDHILGNKFVAETYGLKLEMHALELPVLHALSTYAARWGIDPEPSPEPEILLEEGNTISFGTSSLEVLFTPGHSSGSISFYSKGSSLVIAGDVLFRTSIGRTDLPGGDYDTLIKSIREKLFTLPDDTKVYPGHGPSTTIGFEKKNNPFLS